MKLYVDPITVNCRKVLAGFNLMGTQYEPVQLGYFAGDMKKPEYLAINPNGSLPALVDGDLKLWESNAILQYAADKGGRSDLYPTDLKVRADINRWLLWEANQWFPACYVYLVENLVKPVLQQPTDAAALAANEPRFHLLAGILDDRLATSPDAPASLPEAAARELPEHPYLDRQGRGPALLGRHRPEACARARLIRART